VAALPLAAWPIPHRAAPFLGPGAMDTDHIEIF